MKTQWKLRTFLFASVVLAVAICLTWESLRIETVELEQDVLAPVTLGSDFSSIPLTLTELIEAISMEEKRTVNVDSASMEEIGNSVDAPRDEPLIGRSQLHRTTYKCKVEGEFTDGTKFKRVYFVDKTQFQLVD